MWVSVEPSTDSWALGILAYAMLTGSHPWAETASDCQSYLKYREWFNGAKRPEDDLDVWAEPQRREDGVNLNEAGQGRKGHVPVAPQFACFTSLAHFLFHSLLDPRPQLRGRPEDALSYLGGDWMMEKERVKLEKERKKKKGAVRQAKDPEGRGQR